MRKAQIFSIDAIISAVIATTLLAAIVLSFNAAEAEHSPIVTLRQNAEDALAAMDKQGVLRAVFTQSDADAHGNLTAFLNASIPTHLGANITVEIFEYEPGGSCSPSCSVDGGAPSGSFCTCKRLSNSTAASCNATTPCNYASQAKRMVYDFVSGEDRFVRATLGVWTKS